MTLVPSHFSRMLYAQTGMTTIPALQFQTKQQEGSVSQHRLRDSVLRQDAVSEQFTVLKDDKGEVFLSFLEPALLLHVSCTEVPFRLGMGDISVSVSDDIKTSTDGSLSL